MGYYARVSLSDQARIKASGRIKAGSSLLSCLFWIKASFLVQASQSIRDESSVPFLLKSFAYIIFQNTGDNKNVRKKLKLHEKILTTFLTADII